jgi:hypothetical protein
MQSDCQSHGEAQRLRRSWFQNFGEKTMTRIKEATLAPISQAQVPKSLRSWRARNFGALYERHKLTTNVILVSDGKSFAEK